MDSPLRDMSAYSTIYITREQAEDMVMAVRRKKERPLSHLTVEELDKELHEYVYSENYPDEVGFLRNYNITD